jgi:hypothetical protein
MIFLGLQILSPALMDFRARISTSLKPVFEDMAQHPVRRLSNPRYTNMRPYKPNVTINHSILDDEAGAKTAEGIFEELKLEYTRGIAPVKAVSMCIA